MLTASWLFYWVHLIIFEDLEQMEIVVLQTGKSVQS